MLSTDTSICSLNRSTMRSNVQPEADRRYRRSSRSCAASSTCSTNSLSPKIRSSPYEVFLYPTHGFEHAPTASASNQTTVGQFGPFALADTLLNESTIVTASPSFLLAEQGQHTCHRLPVVRDGAHPATVAVEGISVQCPSGLKQSRPAADSGEGNAPVQTKRGPAGIRLIYSGFETACHGGGGGD